MRVLFQVSAVLAVVFATGIGLRESLHATQTPAVDSPGAQADGCGCANCQCGAAQAAELERLMGVYAAHHDAIEAFNVYFDRSIPEKIIAWEAADCPISPEFDPDITETLQRYESEYEFGGRPSPVSVLPSVAVPEEPEPIATIPGRTVDEVMEGLQEAYEPEPRTIPTHTSDGYLTRPAIESWLASHGGIRSWRYGGGNGGDALRSHLISAHGWRSDQVSGLSDSELRELHSASHERMLRPRSSINVNLAMAPADDLVPMENDDDGYWYWIHGGRTYRWHTLEEGRTYGGRFLYSGGRMHVVASEPRPVTQPVSQTVYRPPVFSSGSGCPGGRCPMPTIGRRGRR